MNKQTITLDHVMSDSDIIVTSTSSCSYVDDYFFKHSMKDLSGDERNEKNEKNKFRNFITNLSFQFNNNIMTNKKTYAVKM